MKLKKSSDPYVDVRVNFLFFWGGRRSSAWAELKETMSAVRSAMENIVGVALELCWAILFVGVRLLFSFTIDYVHGVVVLDLVCFRRRFVPSGCRARQLGGGYGVMAVVLVVTLFVGRLPRSWTIIERALSEAGCFASQSAHFRAMCRQVSSPILCSVSHRRHRGLVLPHLLVSKA